MIQVDLSPIYTFRYIEVPTHGFSYLMLDENNRALHTPFKCKDYLHDIFYAEYTGNTAVIYGIDWEKGRLNTDTEFFHLALLGGKENNLHERIPFMTQFLNELEEVMGIPKTTIHEGQNPGIVVVEFSKEWTKSGPQLSVLATSVRAAGAYLGEGIIPYMKKMMEWGKTGKFNPTYIQYEVAAAPTLIKRYAALLAGKTIDASWTMFDSEEEIEYCSCGCGEIISGHGDSMEAVHDTGMLNFGNFPEMEVA